MQHEELDARMRAKECFHGIRVLPDAWTVIRLDGRSFSKFTEDAGFEKPFDAKFKGLMVETSRQLLKELQALYVYTESDEISVLMPRNFDLFDRELEKLVSVSASVATAAFVLETAKCVNFDSRLWVGVNEADVVDYFRWRQNDAHRNALNGWCYWTLRKEGKSVHQATNELIEKGFDYKNELLHQRGINFNATPLWQRRGVGIYWMEYQKEGYNPITKEKVMATRRGFETNEELPLGDEYGRFIQEITRKET